MPVRVKSGKSLYSIGCCLVLFAVYYCLLSTIVRAGEVAPKEGKDISEVF